MKERVFSISLILIVIGLLTTGTLYAFGGELPAQDPVTLKQKANIDIKEIPTDYVVSDSFSGKKLSPISMQQAIDAANVYTSNLFNNAKIKAQKNLLTDNVFTIQALDKTAIDADPILKTKSEIKDIPVWLVSYQGINLERQKTKFTEQVVVVDAISGKVLYSFRYR